MENQLPQPLIQNSTEPVPQHDLPITNAPVETHHTSPIVIVLLLIFFAPLAWYFMWIEKRYHKWFAFLILFFASISLITISLMYFIVIPKMIGLYRELKIENIPDTRIPLLIGLTLNLIQLGFGAYLFKKAKSPLPTPKIFLIGAIIFLLINMFGLITVYFSVFGIIQPIYNLTAEF